MAFTVGLLRFFPIFLNFLALVLVVVLLVAGVNNGLTNLFYFKV